MTLIFRGLTSCGLVGRYQHFRGTHCILSTDGGRQYVPPKQWYLLTSPYTMTAEKTNINIFTDVITSNLISTFPFQMTDYQYYLKS
jgi:hypothetical protein